MTTKILETFKVNPEQPLEDRIRILKTYFPLMHIANWVNIRDLLQIGTRKLAGQLLEMTDNITETEKLNRLSRSLWLMQQKYRNVNPIQIAASTDEEIRSLRGIGEVYAVALTQAFNEWLIFTSSEESSE